MTYTLFEERKIEMRKASAEYSCVLWILSNFIILEILVHR